MADARDRRGGWRTLPEGLIEAAWSGGARPVPYLALRFTGEPAKAGEARAAFEASSLLGFWVGLTGEAQRLTVIIGREAGRSPHYWFGRSVLPGEAFDIELVVNPDMGPGGLLACDAGDRRWSSLSGASAHGAERLDWPRRWSVGQGPAGAQDRPFAGADLRAMVATA